jgi:hypothetical protein
MTTPSPEQAEWERLVAELKELSGWKFDLCDGYSLEFLLEKIDFYHWEASHNTTGEYVFEVWLDGRGLHLQGGADTAKLAVLKLACELFRAGVLKK